LPIWLSMFTVSSARFILAACWASNLLLFSTFLVGLWLEFCAGTMPKWIHAVAMFLFYCISLIICPVMMSSAAVASR
jgi:hypothetical protein